MTNFGYFPDRSTDSTNLGAIFPPIDPFQEQFMELFDEFRCCSQHLQRVLSTSATHDEISSPFSMGSAGNLWLCVWPQMSGSIGHVASANKCNCGKIDNGLEWKTGAQPEEEAVEEGNIGGSGGGGGNWRLIEEAVATSVAPGDRHTLTTCFRWGFNRCRWPPEKERSGPLSPTKHNKTKSGTEGGNFSATISNGQVLLLLVSVCLFFSPQHTLTHTQTHRHTHIRIRFHSEGSQRQIIIFIQLNMSIVVNHYPSFHANKSWPNKYIRIHFDWKIKT